MEDILAQDSDETVPVKSLVGEPRKVWLSDVDGGHVTMYETLEEAQRVLRTYIYPVTRVADPQEYYGFCINDKETRVYRDLEKCMKWATESMITEGVLYD